MTAGCFPFFFLFLVAVIALPDCSGISFVLLFVVFNVLRGGSSSPPEDSIVSFGRGGRFNVGSLDVASLPEEGDAPIAVAGAVSLGGRVVTGVDDAVSIAWLTVSDVVEESGWLRVPGVWLLSSMRLGSVPSSV